MLADEVSGLLQVTNDAFDEPPEALLEDLSRTYHEAFWLEFQTKAGSSFAYLHWRDGVKVRELVFDDVDSGDGWVTIEGAPQPWESTAPWDTPSLGELGVDDVHDLATHVVVSLGKPRPEPVTAKAASRATKPAMKKSKSKAKAKPKRAPTKKPSAKPKPKPKR